MQETIRFIIGPAAFLGAAPRKSGFLLFHARQLHGILKTATVQRGLAGPTLAACRRVWRDTVRRAASLLLNGRGRNLQDLLGHKSLSTTARYTHIDRGRLRSVVDDHSLARVL